MSETKELAVFVFFLIFTKFIFAPSTFKTTQPMKNTIYLLLFSILFYSCNPEENKVEPVSATNQLLVLKSTLNTVPDGKLYTQQEIDQNMYNQVKATNDFSWEKTDLKMVCSAAVITQLIAIGYQPAFIKDVREKLSSINIHSDAWKNVHDELLKLIQVELKKSGIDKNVNDLITEDDQTLPIITLRIADAKVITALSNLENVRYIEPYGYWPSSYISRTTSSSGCTGSSYALNSADYTTIYPGCKMSWNYNNVNVMNAWSVAQGQGITIGIIDAGISTTQSLLGSNFNNGESNVGRTLTTDYTYGTTAYTGCAHGTSMCGIAAGPRNNLGGPTGVAYKANLVFIRACNDVVLDESAELSGVRSALIKMGNNVAVKIVSMSVGTPFSSSTLYDGVSYAYGKGKLIYAAAGTSFSWTSWWGVIYPAYYSECVAITGVNESSTTCSNCHDGSKVLLTIPMQRNANSERTTLSLPISGYTPAYVGGSSCATAFTAGVAALVWSVNPNLTRAQVSTCLKNTAQYYPVLSWYDGFGNVNAYNAVLMAQGM